MLIIWIIFFSTFGSLGAILTASIFLRINEELDSYEDLRCLRKAKESERDASTISIDKLKKEIG